MLSRTTRLLVATVMGSAVLAGGGFAALAQMRPPSAFPVADFDPAQLPEFKGKVTQYILTPRGDVDGLMLADGTEVAVPPRLSSALVFSVRPGDQISLRGLKARNAGVVAAVTITNIASGAVIGGEGDSPAPWGGPRMEVNGTVKAALHTPHGDVRGVLLEDGTTLRLPPHQAEKFAELLKPGARVFANGFGVNGPLGKSMAALEIGPSADKLTPVAMPHRGMMEGRMHGPMPEADTPPPPPAR